MDKPVFITGITGVIGYAFARQLLSAGHRVIAPIQPHAQPTDLYKRRADALQILKDEAGNRLVIHVQPDPINAKDLIKQKFLLGQCDVVYHFGAWSRHKIEDEDLPAVLAANVVWTGALVKLAAETGLKRFVFASTRSVYDLITRAANTPLLVDERTAISPLPEINEWQGRALPAIDGYLGLFLRGKTDQTPEAFCRQFLFSDRPSDKTKRFWYHLTKLMGETIVMSLWEKGVEGINLRLKPVIGPSPVEQESRTVPRTVLRLLANRTETAWPSKTGFLYLEDLIYALEFLNSSYHGIPRLPKEASVLLLGRNRQDLDQFDLYCQISKIIAADLEIKFDPGCPERKDEIFDATYSAELLRLRSTPFNYALQRTVRYFVDRHFLEKAIELADLGEPENYCKVGVLIVKDGKVIGSHYKDARNRIHSDVLAIADVIKNLARTDTRIAECSNQLLELLNNNSGDQLYEGTMSAKFKMLVMEVIGNLSATHGLNLFEGATLYINIEPCYSESVWIGCAEVIAKAGIRRVVTASEDPGLWIKGRGLAYLKEQGIEVVMMRELEAEAKAIDPDWHNGKKVAVNRELKRHGRL